MRNSNLRTPKRRKHRGGSNAAWIIPIVILSVLIVILLALVVMMKNPPESTKDTVPPWMQGAEKGGEEVEYKPAEEKYNFLVVGKDNVALNTDVMMLVNLDLKNSSMTMMQMARDTFVTVDNQGRKLNSVYGYYYNQSDAKKPEDKIRDGMEGLVNFFEETYMIDINYYANLNLDAFGNIVDAIGGVEMDVPHDLYYVDHIQDLYIDIKAGHQVLDGNKAQQFVRFRSGYLRADLDRQDAQKLFMTAFIKSFQENVSIKNITPIVTTVLDNLTHSLKLDDSVYFATQAMSLDFNNVTMLSAPSGLYNSGGSYVVIHRQAMYNIINEHFNLWNHDIPEEKFDEKRNLTMLTNSAINNIYESTEEFDGERTAQDIQDEGVDITHVY